MQSKKKGYLMVEAAMILPLVVLTLVGSIALLVDHVEKVNKQVEEHLDQRNDGERNDADFIRNVDAVKKIGN